MYIESHEEPKFCINCGGDMEGYIEYGAYDPITRVRHTTNWVRCAKQGRLARFFYEHVKWYQEEIRLNSFISRAWYASDW
jgi:hypothetical protein